MASRGNNAGTEIAATEFHALLTNKSRFTVKPANTGIFSGVFQENPILGVAYIFNKQE